MGFGCDPVPECVGQQPVQMHAALRGRGAGPLWEQGDQFGAFGDQIAPDLLIGRGQIGPDVFVVVVRFLANNQGVQFHRGQ